MSPENTSGHGENSSTHKPGPQPSGLGRLLVQSFHEESTAKNNRDLALLARLAPYVRAHAMLFVLSLVLMPAVAVAALFQPYLVKEAIEAALVQHSNPAVLRVAMWFGVAVLAEFVTRFIQVYLMQLAGQRTMGDLRSTIFRHIQKLPLSYFDRTPVGRTVTRVTNDVDSLGELFASGAITAIGDVLMLIGIVVFMLVLDWKLSLVAFAALPFVAIVVEVFRRYAREAFRAIRAHIAQLNAYLAEQVQGIAVVQAFGREERCQEEYRTINAAYRDANHRAIRYDALLYSVVDSVATAFIAIILWYASVKAGLLSSGPATAAYVGIVVAFYEYIQRFFVPIRDLSGKYTIVQSSLAAAERIFTLLDMEERDAPVLAGVPDSGDASREVTPAAISFENVSFEYRENAPVLRDVTFTVQRGEKIAIVGATGSGKTTVVSLLLRLYDTIVGRIRINEDNVKDLSANELRRRFSVVPQDAFLFAGTILENVALGAEMIDEARAVQCLEHVGAWHFVQERPGGIHARVEERGGNFSAGERQLIAFARALYREPEILILDEATAHIDSETEAGLQTAVLKLLAGRTALVIAHRLSTIRHADRILVFHHGQIVEQGTHQTLLRAGGIYARLCQLQFETDPQPTTPSQIA